jgi:hypothetical protein
MPSSPPPPKKMETNAKIHEIARITECEAHTMLIFFSIYCTRTHNFTFFTISSLLSFAQPQSKCWLLLRSVYLHLVGRLYEEQKSSGQKKIGSTPR